MHLDCHSKISISFKDFAFQKQNYPKFCSPDVSEFVSIRSAQRMTGKSNSTISEAVKRGEIPGLISGEGKCLGVHLKSCVARFCDENGGMNKLGPGRPKINQVPKE